MTLLEAEKEPGGTLRFGIPSYRLPNHVLDQEINDILSLGVELKTSQLMGRDYRLESLRADGYDAVLSFHRRHDRQARAHSRRGCAGRHAGGGVPAQVNWGERVDLGSA